MSAQLRAKTMLLLDIYDTFREPPAEDIWGRFTPKLIITSLSDCWFWTGAHGNPKHKAPYGVFSGDGKTRDVQRVWGRWIFGAAAIQGLEMDHYVCSNYRCVNPTHLLPVPHEFNSIRPGARTFGAKNAAKTHCPNGHELTEENCIPCEWRGNKQRRGRRICAACRREWNNNRNYRRNRVAADASIPPEELIARITNGRSHCPKGHELTPDNCVLYELRVGTKACKICRTAYHQQRWLDKQKKQKAHIEAFRAEQLQLTPLQPVNTGMEF